jgi:hypothetical protein
MAYSSTLKKGRVRSFETSANLYKTTRRQILEYGNLHSDRCQNLEYNKLKFSLARHLFFNVGLQYLSQYSKPYWGSKDKNLEHK